MTNAPPQIFDRPLYALHRARGAARQGDVFLACDAAEGLAERIGAVTRTFSNALDIGSRNASFALLEPLAAQWTRIALPGAATEDLALAPEQFDLVVSVLALHAVNDLPGALIQIRRALKPDGLFIAALFGGATLQELREALAAAESDTAGGVGPRVVPFADVRDLGALLQRAGFALPVADVERTRINYGNFSKLVSDLRDLGETNALSRRRRRPLSTATAAQAAAHYAVRYGLPDGRLPATFDTLYLAGWAPHASQPQPLAPGSARNRLADALRGDEEKPAK